MINPSLGGIRAIRMVRLPKNKDAQVYQTLEEMIRIAQRDAWSRSVRELAAQASPFLSWDGLDRARAYCSLVRERMTFQHDPPDVELLVLPSFLAYQILHGMPARGDCDDYALLLGAMLQSQAIEAGFRVISTSPDCPDFRHVFVVARVGSIELPLDPTIDVRRHRPFPGQRVETFWIPVHVSPPPLP